MGHMLVGVTDTAFVGFIGETEQAAILLANTPYVLLLVFGIGVAYGITPLVSEADSKGDKETIRRVMRNGILLNLSLGIGLFVVLYFSTGILNYLNQPAEVIDLAIPFLNVLVLSLVPLGIFSACKQLAEGLSLTRVAMIITVTCNFLNIFLNWVLIFGKLGFPEMGMMGSCWATFIARCVMAIWMYVYIRWGDRFNEYWKSRKETDFSWGLSRRIFYLGAGTGFQWVFEVGAFSFAAIMVGWISVTTMAAHQVALSVAAMTYMIASGLSAAASVRVGNELGRNDHAELKKANAGAYVLALCFMIFFAFIFILFRESFAGWLTKSEEVATLASSLLIIAAFFQISDGTQVVGLGVLRALKDVKVPTLITLFSYWVIGIPCSYWFGFPLNMGVHGIWYGLFLGLTVAAVLLYLRVNYIRKKLADIK